MTQDTRVVADVRSLDQAAAQHEAAAADAGCQNAQRIPGLPELMRSTRGSALVRIAIIDGVVENHPVLAQSTIIQPERRGHAEQDREARAHATFVASILAGTGGLGICPACTIVSVPAVYGDFAQQRLSPEQAARRLAACVRQALELGADVLHFSLEFAPQVTRPLDILGSALRLAAARGIRSVVAAGNSAAVSVSPLLAEPGVVPVAMAGRDGRLDERSNRGALIGMRGLLAPGVDIEGAELPGGTGNRWGTSYAAALVTGAFALVQSHFVSIDRERIWAALINPLTRLSSRSIVPPPLDLRSSVEILTRQG